jgi:uncharacterized protein
MQWEGREESTNVEDERGRTGTALAIGGGGSLLILILGLIFGFRPQIPQQPPGGQPDGQREQTRQRQLDPEEERMARFTRVILHDTEVVWDDLFRQMGKQYTKPTLRLFTESTNSGCGFANAQIGPFYCPADSKVYIDLGFYKEMERKLRAPGEFARAYVVAHEVGHHVQRLLGYSRAVDEARERYGAKSEEALQMSVRLELQADYLAGVWAHHGQREFKFLEKGDIESALNAAYRIGDDYLQKESQGYVVPEKFTHGSSKQRQRWFMEGFQTGDVKRAAALFQLPYRSL